MTFICANVHFDKSTLTTLSVFTCHISCMSACVLMLWKRCVLNNHAKENWETEERLTKRKTERPHPLTHLQKHSFSTQLFIDRSLYLHDINNIQDRENHNHYNGILIKGPVYEIKLHLGWLQPTARRSSVADTELRSRHVFVFFA